MTSTGEGEGVPKLVTKSGNEGRTVSAKSDVTTQISKFLNYSNRHDATGRLCSAKLFTLFTLFALAASSPLPRGP